MSSSVGATQGLAPLPDASGALARAREVSSARSAPRVARRPNALVRGAFLLFVATIPFEMLPLVGEQFAVTRMFGIVFALAALTQPAVTLRRPPAAFWWFAGYLGAVLVMTVPLYESLGLAIVTRLITLGQLLLMFWISVNVLRDERVSGRALVTYGVACTVIAVLMSLGIAQTSIKAERGLRLSFAGGNVNAVAGTLALGLLALIGLAYTAKLSGRWWKFVVPGFSAVLAFAIMDTGSRGAVVGLIGGLAVLVAQGENAVRRLSNFALFAVVAGFVYFAVYTTIISRARWEEAVVSRRMTGRELIYPVQWRMVGERPVLGWGPEGNRRELGRRVPMLERESLDAHNLFLHVLTEVGIIGALPFLIGLSVCFGSARRASRTNHGLLPLVLLCAVLAANMASNWMLRKPLWFFMAYAVASGIAVVEPKRRRWARRRLLGASGPTAASLREGVRHE